MPIAPAHGAVDLDDAVGDFGEHASGVDNVIAEQLPEQRSGAMGGRNQRAKPLWQILDVPRNLHRRKFGLLYRMIFEGLPIEGVNLLGHPDALVEALAGLIAKPGARNHLLHEGGDYKPLAKWIARS